MLGFHYAQTDSTNLLVRRLAMLNFGRPLAVSAVVQTAGRGREGRSWSSPPGGAWFSVGWPLRAAAPIYRTAPLAVGLAVHEALSTILPSTLKLTIKWPNDLLLQNRKVAGILCEMDLSTAKPDSKTEGSIEPPISQVASSSAYPHGLLIVGVGINVNLDPALLGSNLRWPATSVWKELGWKVSVPQLIQCCVDHIENRLTELETSGLSPSMLEAIGQRLSWVGQMVRLQWQGQSVTGCCRGVDEQGFLELWIDGCRKVFDAGEISALSLDDSPMMTRRQEPITIP